MLVLRLEMLNLKNISYFLRYPLMAVMLLWALTLPGQEVEVYSFLVKSISAGTSQKPISAPENKSTATLEQQAVHVFLDAKTSSTIVVSLQQVVSNPLLLLACVFPVGQALPACHVHTTGTELLSKILAVVIQPNAP